MQEKKDNQQQERREFEVEVGEDATKYGEFVSSYFKNGKRRDLLLFLQKIKIIKDKEKKYTKNRDKLK